MTLTINDAFQKIKGQDSQDDVMNTTFRLRTLTIITFCLYIFWGAFGVDMTLSPGVDRVPLHRVFLLSTAFIFLFNVREVLAACLNNKLLIALLLYVLLTTGWVNTPSETLKNFVFLSSAMFISMMTALAFVDNRMALIRTLFWLFLVMVVSSIVAALFFPKIGVNTVDFGKPRWIGITTHPNILGVLSLVLIWLSSNLFFLSKRKLEKISIIFAAIAAFYLIQGQGGHNA